MDNETIVAGVEGAPFDPVDLVRLFGLPDLAEQLLYAFAFADELQGVTVSDGTLDVDTEGPVFDPLTEGEVDLQSTVVTITPVDAAAGARLSDRLTEAEAALPDLEDARAAAEQAAGAATDAFTQASTKLTDATAALEAAEAELAAFETAAPFVRDILIGLPTLGLSQAEIDGAIEKFRGDLFGAREGATIAVAAAADEFNAANDEFDDAIEQLRDAQEASNTTQTEIATLSAILGEGGLATELEVIVEGTNDAPQFTERAAAPFEVPFAGIEIPISDLVTDPDRGDQVFVNPFSIEGLQGFQTGPDTIVVQPSGIAPVRGEVTVPVTVSDGFETVEGTLTFDVEGPPPPPQFAFVDLDFEASRFLFGGGELTEFRDNIPLDSIDDAGAFDDFVAGLDNFALSALDGAADADPGLSFSRGIGVGDGRISGDEVLVVSIAETSVFDVATNGFVVLYGLDEEVRVFGERIVRGETAEISLFNDGVEVASATIEGESFLIPSTQDVELRTLFGITDPTQAIAFDEIRIAAGEGSSFSVRDIGLSVESDPGGFLS